MRFRQVTSSKYIGPNGYTLRQSKDGLFSIFKDNVLADWNYGFITVSAAERFLDHHDYIHATASILPISNDDLNFVVDMYGMNEYRPGLFRSDKADLLIPSSFKDGEVVTIYPKTKKYPIVKTNDLTTLFNSLDDIQEGDIFSSVSYRGTNLRDILAKRSSRPNKRNLDRRSPREITRNLSRVKSSNVWSYGIEIKEAGDNVGDVYVQFKGKNGGPGDVYRYYDVDINTWRKIISAPSKGHAIWQFLRNNFLYSKLTGDKRGRLPNAIN